MIFLFIILWLVFNHFEIHFTHVFTYLFIFLVIYTIFILFLTSLICTNTILKYANTFNIFYSSNDNFLLDFLIYSIILGFVEWIFFHNPFISIHSTFLFYELA